MKRVSTRFAGSALAPTFALAAIAGCGVDNALVGGRCADGYVLAGTSCIEAPPPDGVRVIDPGNAPDGGAHDGASAASSDAATDGASDEDVVVARETDGSVVDTPLDAGVAEAPDAAILPPPPPPPPLVCDASLVACHGACIDASGDGQNCGACGKICPSNICIAGVCQGATPGDVVLVGHDFTNAWTGSAQAKVLVDAVSIPTTDPIRVLSYEDGAPAAAVAQARALVTAGITRQVAFTTASADDLASPSLATAYDVVLVHDGSGSDPATLGASWSAALGTFTQKGGVVIALDGAASRMPELVTATGLLHVDAHAALPDGTHLVVAAPNDVVGTQVLSPYAAFGRAIAFSGVPAAADTTVVVREDAPDLVPVVIHRVVR